MEIEQITIGVLIVFAGSFLGLILKSQGVLKNITAKAKKEGAAEEQLSNIEKDINGIGKKVATVQKELKGEITDLSKRLDEQEKEHIELKTQFFSEVQNIKQSLQRIESKMG